ncbi:hypothetical protein AB205_0147090 [Aquarana catesbeiana]|uniref:Amine oxidase domain-containing protein n=1 Tax=Aquarana catesbeiana TaxID=8400 RepID=A0A2G9RCB4_AQUCT|nr:hypothetical protein AB205_0147090 [Aquarana catesbeiana]
MYKTYDEPRKRRFNSSFCLIPSVRELLCEGLLCEGLVYTRSGFPTTSEVGGKFENLLSNICGRKFRQQMFDGAYTRLDFPTTSSHRTFPDGKSDCVYAALKFALILYGFVNLEAKLSNRRYTSEEAYTFLSITDESEEEVTYLSDSGSVFEPIDSSSTLTDSSDDEVVVHAKQILFGYSIAWPCNYQLKQRSAKLLWLDEITGGFDQLPLALAKYLGNVIRLKSTVVKVRRNEKSVIVYYRKDRTTPPTSIIADYVIITSTAKATKRIKFSPPLSNEKDFALGNIHYASATKILLGCSESFWEKDGIVGGRSITDRPSRYIYYPSHNFTGGRGVLLASYTLSDESSFFLSLSDEECIDIVFEDLAAIHLRPEEELRRLCPKTVVKRWSLDSYSMGAFAHFIPYQYSNLFEYLAQPEGRIYFAGEHTSAPHGWIDTAIKTGLKAARAVHRDANTFLHR